MDDAGRLQLNQYLREFAKTYNCTHEILVYQNLEYYHIRIFNLKVENCEINLTNIPLKVQGNIEINLNFEFSSFVNSDIKLPDGLNQVEFSKSILRRSKIYLDGIAKKVESGVDGSNAMLGSEKSVDNSTIIAIQYSELDDLSTFDQIQVNFILQCDESRFNRIHTSYTLPHNLIVLSVKNCNIQTLGTIRTNTRLQLLMLHIVKTEDVEFILELRSSNLLKMGIIGKDEDSNLQGSIKFYCETPRLYHMDFNRIQLMLIYENMSYLFSLMENMFFLHFPAEGVELDDRMKSFFRLMSVPSSLTFFRGYS